MARIELADALTVGLSTLPPVSAFIPFKRPCIPFTKVFQKFLPFNSFKKIQKFYLLVPMSKVPRYQKNGVFWGGGGLFFTFKISYFFF